MSGGNPHQQHPDCSQPRHHWFAGELSSPSMASSGRSSSLTSLESVSSLGSVSESTSATPKAPADWRPEHSKTKETAVATVDQLVDKPAKTQNHNRGSPSSLFAGSGTTTPAWPYPISSLAPQDSSPYTSLSPSVSKSCSIERFRPQQYSGGRSGGGTSSDSDSISGASSVLDTQGVQGRRASDFSLINSGSLVKASSGFLSSSYCTPAEYEKRYWQELDRKARISQKFESVRGVWSSKSTTGPSHSTGWSSRILIDDIMCLTSIAVTVPPHNTTGPNNIAEIQSKLASAGLLASSTAPSQTADNRDFTTPRPPSPVTGLDRTIRASTSHLTTSPIRSTEIIPSPAASFQATTGTIETIAGVDSQLRNSEAVSSAPDPHSGGINCSSGLRQKLNLDCTFCFGGQQQQQQIQQQHQSSSEILFTFDLSNNSSSKLIEKEDMSGSVASGLSGGVGAGEGSPEGEQTRLSGGMRRGRGQFGAGAVGLLGGKARALNIFGRVSVDLQGMFQIAALDNWRQPAQSPPQSKPASGTLPPEPSDLSQTDHHIDTTSSPSSVTVLAPAIGNFSPGPSQGYNPGFPTPVALRSPASPPFSPASSCSAVLSPGALGPAPKQSAPFPGPSAAAGVFLPGTQSASGTGLGFGGSGGYDGGSGFSPVGLSGGPSFVDPPGFASLSLSDPATARHDFFAVQGQLAPAQIAQLCSPPTSQHQGMFGFPSSSIAGGGPAIIATTTTALPPTPTSRAQSWDMGQYQSQYLVTVGPDTQGYCFVRPDGSRTRLVPVDMLPFSLVGVPATENDNDKLVELMIPAGLDGRCKNSNTQRAVIQTPPHGRHQDAIQNRIDHILASAPQTSSTAAASGAGTGPLSPSYAPPKRVKIYCDKWVHEGTCAFTQQGCKYKHEMPMDKATQHSLGLFQGLPTWWKKRQAELSRESERGSSERGGGISVGGRFAAGGSGGAGAGPEGRKSNSGWSRWENAGGGGGGTGGGGAGGTSGARRGSSSGSESGFHSSNWRMRGPTPGQ
ncbi:hypothetical protein B0T21DRAFT_430634 [Apiosordaria backusii]|uniref:C3H1-type domain-containing protein n=1 Tax=Apiosordaria backusii TaxID=314023 RepID=A0AA40ETJ8_9PEZI|nr:hypothetical protein B0T21DRAFT_430634 [Apiosordaria backusii]